MEWSETYMWFSVIQRSFYKEGRTLLARTTYLLHTFQSGLLHPTPAITGESQSGLAKPSFFEPEFGVVQEERMSSGGGLAERWMLQN